MKTQTMLLTISVACLGMLLDYNCSINTSVDDDVLRLQRRPYTGKELRIDGYYYLDDSLQRTRDVYFFYANGILLSGGSFPFVNLETKEAEFKNGTLSSNSKNNKPSWGVFQVDSITIQYEKWYPEEDVVNGLYFATYTSSGHILNDTTFHIEKLKSWHAPSNGTSKDDFYHFKIFSPKPDSLNKYIP